MNTTNRGENTSGLNRSAKWLTQRAALKDQIEQWNLQGLSGVEVLCDVVAESGDWAGEDDLMIWLIAGALKREGFEKSGKGSGWVEVESRDRVLRLIVESPGGMGTSDLCRATGLSRSSIRRILGELEDKGEIGRKGEGNFTVYIAGWVG